MSKQKTWRFGINIHFCEPVSEKVAWKVLKRVCTQGLDCPRIPNVNYTVDKIILTSAD